MSQVLCRGWKLLLLLETQCRYTPSLAVCLVDFWCTNHPLNKHAMDAQTNLFYNKRATNNIQSFTIFASARLV